MIDEGRIKSYAEVARLLGVTRARVTQTLNLLGLSPRIEEQILTGEVAVSERALRAVVAEARWEVQGTLLPE